MNIQQRQQNSKLIAIDPFSDNQATQKIQLLSREISNQTSIQQQQCENQNLKIIQKSPSTKIIFKICCLIISLLAFSLLFTTLFDALKVKISQLINGQNIDDDQPYKEGDQTQELYDLVKLNSTTALCLDGSPGSYYESRTGDPSRIILFLQGGGWCSTYHFQQGYYTTSCFYRSRGDFGTSTTRSPSLTVWNGVMSKQPANYFRNWKKIRFNYCDGSGYQGSRKQPLTINDTKLYFRGHNITTEIFYEIQKKFGLFSMAKRVVLTGQSAGGMAVFTWANYLGERVRNGKFYVIPDAGIFYDAENINSKQNNYKNFLGEMMAIANEQTDPPNPECIKKFPSSKINCMFAQNIYEHIRYPMFAVNSLYDSYSLPNILGINPWQDLTEEQSKLMQENRKNVTDILLQIGKNTSNGAFGISCIVHGITAEVQKFANTNYTIPAGSQFTVSKSIQNWFKYPNMNNVHVDIVAKNYGCYK